MSISREEYFLALNTIEKLQKVVKEYRETHNFAHILLNPIKLSRLKQLLAATHNLEYAHGNPQKHKEAHEYIYKTFTPEEIGTFQHMASNGDINAIYRQSCAAIADSVKYLQKIFPQLIIND